MLSLIVVFGVLVCGWADSTQSTGAKSSTPVEEFSANFTNIGNVGGTGATPISSTASRPKFPAAQKGTVQNCPHCKAYVDVGDDAGLEGWDEVPGEDEA